MGTDYDRVLEIVQDKELADKVIQLFIEIAGERIQTAGQAQYSTLEQLLSNGMIKPEHQKTVYERMKVLQERL